MAQSPDTEDVRAAELQQELREDVNNAYAFIEGQKTVQTFAAISFEELLDQQIERLVGGDDPARPNVLTRVQRIESDIVRAVAQIKKLPPEFFNAPPAESVVNTPVEG